MYGFELNAGLVYIKYVGIVVYFVYLFFMLKQYRLTVNGSASASTSATKLTDQINYLSSKYSWFGAAFKNMAHKVTLTQRLAYTLLLRDLPARMLLQTVLVDQVKHSIRHVVCVSVYLSVSLNNNF